MVRKTVPKLVPSYPLCYLVAPLPLSATALLSIMITVTVSFLISAWAKFRYREPVGNSETWSPNNKNVALKGYTHTQKQREPQPRLCGCRKSKTWATSCRHTSKTSQNTPNTQMEPALTTFGATINPLEWFTNKIFNSNGFVLYVLKLIVRGLHSW